MALKNKIQSNEGVMKQFSDEIRNLTQAVSKVVGISERVDEIDHVLREIIAKIYYHDQLVLNPKMDIYGLSVNNVKDTRVFVINYLKELGIEITPSEVISAYELTKKFKNGSKKFIRVIFSHENIKRRVICMKIRRDKGKKTNVFFNDVLTSMNAKLLMEGKELKKKGLIGDIKFLNGRLYALPNGSKNKILVENSNELHEIAKKDESSLKNDVVEDSAIGNSEVSDSADGTPRSNTSFISPKFSHPLNNNKPHEATSSPRDTIPTNDSVQLGLKHETSSNNIKSSQRKSKKRKSKRKS